MKRYPLCLAWFALLLLPLAATALEPTPPAAAPSAPLSLEECLRVALENNPDTAALLHAGRAAVARIGESRSSYWPTASLSGSLSRSYAEAGTGRLKSSPQNGSQATLSTEMLLWDFGNRKATVEGSRASSEAAASRYRASAQDLALSVTLAFQNLQGYLWDLEVAQKTLELASTQLEMARNREAVGLAPRADVLRAATQEADARLALVQARSAVESGRAALAILLGLPADTPLSIREIPRDAPLPALPDWQEGRERARTVLPEIQAALAGERALRFALRSAETAYRPSVTLDGTAGLLDGGRWPDRKTWSVGAFLRVPLFTGFFKSWKVLEARENYRAGQEDTRAVLLSAEKNAWQARLDLEEALHSVEASEALLRSAEENAAVTEGRYREGLATMVDLVDATTALSSARLRAVRSRLSVLQSFARWQRATGQNLLPAFDLPEPTLSLKGDGASAPQGDLSP